MNLFRHYIAGLVIFVALITLMVTIQTGIESSYSVELNDTKTVALNTTGYEGDSTGDIMDQFQNMNVIADVNNIQEALRDLAPGTGSVFDVLGGVLTVGLSGLKLVFDSLLLPGTMVQIVVAYYGGEVAGVIALITTLILVYGGFILLSAFIGKDV